MLAFQLMEIRCDAKGNVSIKRYNTGAFFGLDIDSGLPVEELEKTVNKKVTSKVLKKEFGDAFFESASIDEEDDSPCIVICPRQPPRRRPWLTLLSTVKKELDILRWRI